MTKTRGENKPPSRQRYDDKHRVRSFRLDEENDNRLSKLLSAVDLPLSEWVRNKIQGDEAMIEKKVEMFVAKQRSNPLTEDRIKCVGDLVHQLLSLGADITEYGPICPRCGDQELFRCEGREKDSAIAPPEVLTWKCAKCGFFIDTYRGIDPASIKWIDPESGLYAKKPQSAMSHHKNKH